MNKGLEALDKIIDMALEPNGYLNFQNAVDTPYYQIVSKELKALEIVLNKRVCMDRLIRSDSSTMYNEWNNWDEIDLSTYLTNDEFDLLKEMLK